jgi:hypothetical protein
MARASWCAPLALMTAGCATNAAPGIEVRTVEVVRPVPVACVDPAQIPAEPPTIESARGKGWQRAVDAAQAADLLAASAIELRGALRVARALLIGCAAQ